MINFMIFSFFLFNEQIIFLETICNDRQIIERNIRLKIQQSPDYAEEYASSNHHVFQSDAYAYWNNLTYIYRPDFEAGYQDFKRRLDNYEKVTLNYPKMFC